MRARSVFAAVIAVPLVGVLTLLAGPLDPPAGPVASTYKTLSEIEPRIAVTSTNTPGDSGSIAVISQPGSYYLTAIITGAATKSGVRIAASGVTLDLNGFEIVGVPNSLDGVTVSLSNATDITIRNGTIRAWGGDALDLRTANVSNAIVAHINAAHNSGNGIAAGNLAVVQDCIASNNGLSGVVVGSSSSVTNCAADANGGSSTGLSEGFFIGDGSTISACTSQNNTSLLIGGVGDMGMGFRTGNRCIISGCTAGRNRGHGFRLAAQCRITGCTSVENGSGSTMSAGIYAAGADNTIDANHVIGSDFGIQAIAAGNIIIRNAASGNGADYNLVANNIYGRIIDRRIPTSVPSTPAVNGFAATSALGSTDANANYSY